MIVSGDVRPVGAEQELAFAFFDGMGPDLEGFAHTFRTRMTPDVVWETVGLPARTGLPAALGYLDDLHRRTGMTHCRIEMLAMASSGSRVLSERVDIMCRADGSEIIRFPIMGVLQIRDGRVARYTDYCDLSAVRPPAP